MRRDLPRGLPPLAALGGPERGGSIPTRVDVETLAVRGELL